MAHAVVHTINPRGADNYLVTKYKMDQFKCVEKAEVIYFGTPHGVQSAVFYFKFLFFAQKYGFLNH
jgi:hypothetical protein